MNQPLREHADEPVANCNTNTTAIYVVGAIAALVVTMVILHLTGVVGG